MLVCWEITNCAGLVELTQQCVSPDGAKSTQDVLVVKRARLACDLAASSMTNAQSYVNDLVYV